MFHRLLAWFRGLFQEAPTPPPSESAPDIPVTYDNSYPPEKIDLRVETDLYEMLDKIIQHVDYTGDPVIIDDDPMGRKIGFTCGTRTWRISLLSLKESLFRNPQDKRSEKIRDYFRTAEGKRKITENLTRMGLDRRKAR